jgi:nucleoside-diphosphate-sugar epimerase
MRYLVTGGAGFIGSHLTSALVAQGAHVTVLDNFSTGRAKNLALTESIRLIHGSVLDALLVDELVRDSDVVVHLAAAVGVRLIVERPLHSFVTNIRGAETILEAAHRYRRKVLLASTSEIYGKNSHGPVKEDDDRVLGSNKISRWGYSTSKAVDEVLAFAYHRERGLPTIVVRLFNTVGPRQTGAYGMVLPRFVTQAMEGRPLTVFGDGRQTRCFCHVNDVLDAVIALLNEPRAEGDVFNVGSTEEVSIVELARLVIDATRSSSTIRFVPYSEAYEEGFEDMRRRIPDISKVRDLVGWEPRLDLRDIVEEVVAEAREGRRAGGGAAVELAPAGVTT